MYAGKWCTSVTMFRVRHAQRCSSDTTLSGDNGQISPDVVLDRVCPCLTLAKASKAQSTDLGTSPEPINTESARV